MRRVTPLLVVGLLACGNPLAPRGPAGPPPSLTIVQVTDLGPLPQSPSILGHDGGYSAEFQGKSVWLFSDTFLAAPNTLGRSLISESWGWTTKVDSLHDSAAMFLSETPAETQYNQAHLHTDGQRWALWLVSIVADTERDRALIFYSVVHAAPGNFNFYSTGVSVATWAGFGTTPVRPIGLLFQQNEPAFGAAALIDSGYLYAYGCGTSSSAKPCPLGRVDPASVLDRSAWTYYAGNGQWSPHLSDAISVFSGDDILNVSWNAYLGEYIAIYSEPLSLDVMIRTAPRPEGPWSGERRLFRAMAPAGGGNVYDALAHPELSVGGGHTIYVSYSRGRGQFTSEVRTVAVTLGRVSNQ